jgi:hypothetical protein
MSTIFISYRHEDLGDAGRLYDRLERHFRPEELFFDRSNIESAEMFAAIIEKHLFSAKVILVVMGKHWISPESLKRLHDPEDFVRREVLHGLNRQNMEDHRSPLIVPVLVGEAMLPKVDTLPEPIRPLLQLQYHKLDVKQEDYVRQVAKLVNLISECGLSDLWQRWNRQLRKKSLALLASSFESSEISISTNLNAYWSKFTSTKSWEVKIGSLINTISKLSAGLATLAHFRTDLNNINLIDSYETITAKIRSIMSPEVYDNIEDVLRRSVNRSADEMLRQFKELMVNVSELHEMVKTPQYNKCFLVLGDNGAGKTHFLIKLLGQKEEESTFYCPIDHLDLGLQLQHKLEDVMLEKIKEYSEYNDWKDLKDFHHFLREIDPHARLVLVLDDLQKVIRCNPHVAEDIFRFMVKNNDLRGLYYLLTLEATYFDMVSPYDHFYRNYTFTCYQEEESVTIPNIGGWINLDHINTANKTGFTILAEFFRRKEVDLMAHIWFNDERELTVRRLSSPLMAKIVMSLDEFKPEHLVDLIYIHLFERYWDKRKQAASEFGISCGAIEEVVYVLSNILSRTGDFNPEYTSLVDQVVTLASECNSELKERSFAKMALAVLSSLNLLKVTDAQYSPTAHVPQKVRFFFEMFWEFNCARSLLASDILPVPSTAFSNVETWIGMVGTDDMKERLYEFLSLLLDKAFVDGILTNDFLRQMIENSFESPYLPVSSMLFAGSKTSAATQQLIHNCAISYQFDSRRDLFAFMYLISCLPSGSFDSVAVLRKLQEYFEDIARYELSDYYSFLVQKILTELKNNDEAVEAFQYLSGCEILGLQKQLGSFTSEILLRNSSKWGEVLSAIFMYLNKNSDRADAEYAGGTTGKKAVIFFLRQWLLFNFCDNAVEELCTGAFSFLEEQGWYTSDGCSVHNKYIQHEMELQASLSFGYWYRKIRNESPKKREEYLKLIESLVSSRSTTKKRIGFYMMRNTTITSNRDRIFLDEAFHPYLKTLYRDPTMQGFVRKPENLGVFCSNLDSAFLDTPLQQSQKKRRKKELKKGKKERKRNKQKPGAQ